MKSLVLKYGLIGGIFVSIFMSANMFLVDPLNNMDNSEIIGFAGMIIALSSIFFGVKKIRDQQYAGKISFGKGFIKGLYIALIASTLYVICWMILSAFFFQDFGTEYYNLQIEAIKESGLSAEEIEVQIKSMEDFKENYKNPIFKFFITYVEILPLGILIALISALVLKKK